MHFYFRENDPNIIFLYYVVNNKYIDYIKNNQYKQFSPKWFKQPNMCFMIDIDHARRVAQEKAIWINTTSTYIIRFLIKTSYIKKYAKGALDNKNSYVTIPHTDLHELNKEIIGYLELFETTVL